MHHAPSFGTARWYGYGCSLCTALGGLPVVAAKRRRYRRCHEAWQLQWLRGFVTMFSCGAQRHWRCGPRCASSCPCGPSGSRWRFLLDVDGAGCERSQSLTLYLDDWRNVDAAIAIAGELVRDLPGYAEVIIEVAAVPSAC